MTSCDQTTKVGRGCTGDKCPAARRWKSKDIEEPAQRYLFQCGRDRRNSICKGRLIPCLSQPVGSHCHRQRSADHIAKETRIRCGDGGRGTEIVQERQYSCGVRWCFRQRTLQFLQSAIASGVGAARRASSPSRYRIVRAAASLSSSYMQKVLSTTLDSAI